MRNTSDIVINGTNLDIILEKHKKWLCGEAGERANLRDANLSNANLRYANLRDANLSNADLSDANLSDANLRNANLRDADLSDANLRYANLSYANLSYANLRDANLRDANLRDANLSNADLSDADISDADLSDANLRNADYGNIQCPEEGSFIGFKKLRYNLICKLEITSDAKRSSATSRKCRASKVIVLAIYDKEVEVEEGVSKHDNDFIYRVGETLEIKDFDANRWNECSTGIHFFITRREAEMY